MQRETDEFRDIVDGDWAGGHIAGRRPTAEELTRALQVMLTRQCVYSHTAGIGRTYDIVRAYPTFFERYFGALGYRLAISPRDQMAALEVPASDARYDAAPARLRRDETLVLLGLRLLWEEAVGRHSANEAGRVDTTTDELVDRIRAAGGEAPADEARLVEILRLFARHGAVRLGERDRLNRVWPLAVLPGVAVLAPDAYVRELRRWATASGAEAASPSGAEEGEPVV